MSSQAALEVTAAVLPPLVLAHAGGVWDELIVFGIPLVIALGFVVWDRFR